MTQTPDLTPHQVLVAARTLLSNRDRWTQGAFAKTEKGRVIGPTEAKAVCFCAMGACRHIGGETQIAYRAQDALDRAAQAKFSDAYGPLCIVEVNDELGYEQTLQCFDAAIEETRPCSSSS